MFDAVSTGVQDPIAIGCDASKVENTYSVGIIKIVNSK